MDRSAPSPKFCIPNEEDFISEEIPVSSPGLRAAAHHMGLFCDEESKEFMLCRQELMDPRACLHEGKAVTACALKFFRQVKTTCRQEFEKHAKCLEYSSPDMKYSYCRKTQGYFDRCMLDNMDLERPAIGHFSLPRIHDTPRLEPTLRTPKTYKDPAPNLPEDYPRERAAYGSRLFDTN